jgi:hypothetical protein
MLYGALRRHRDRGAQAQHRRSRLPMLQDRDDTPVAQRDRIRDAVPRLRRCLGGCAGCPADGTAHDSTDHLSEATATDHSTGSDAQHHPDRRPDPGILTGLNHRLLRDRCSPFHRLRGLLHAAAQGEGSQDGQQADPSHDAVCVSATTDLAGAPAAITALMKPGSASALLTPAANAFVNASRALSPPMIWMFGAVPVPS